MCRAVVVGKGVDASALDAKPMLFPKTTRFPFRIRIHVAVDKFG